MATRATTPPAGPDLDALDTAWEQFFSAIRRAKGRAGQRHGSELSLPQLHLLAPLAGGGTARVGELAEAADVAAPTASRMIDSLEREGLVSRDHAAADRRAITVALTDRGRELYERKREVQHAKRMEIFGSLSEAEREQAAHLLGRMAELIDGL
ncbi:MAG TPA: MarR family transcriptional regulator [Solirubrobacterales bacterium]|nr:MarR family transcriptional regulator [Solirubrobacterales bacterium]